MATIIWTEPALNDLNDIAEYIALSHWLAAKQWVRDVLEKVERLEQFPLSGQCVEELPDLNLREVIVKPCRIFYKFIEDKVYILHVIRQERQISQYLLATRSVHDV